MQCDCTTPSTAINYIKAIKKRQENTGKSVGQNMSILLLDSTRKDYFNIIIIYISKFCNLEPVRMSSHLYYRLTDRARRPNRLEILCKKIWPLSRSTAHRSLHTWDNRPRRRWVTDPHVHYRPMERHCSASTVRIK